MIKQRLELLTYLVGEIKKNGAFDVMEKDGNPEKITALYLAAKLGHVQLVKHFLEILDKNYERDSWDGLCRNKNNAIMLHDAAEHNRVDVVKFLCEESFLKTEDYLFDRKNIWESIPFSAAASGNAVKIMKMLLEYGENVGINTKKMLTYQNKHGWSSLHDTAVRGCVEATKFLCDHSNGADIVVLKDNWGSLALHLAAIGGHNEVIEIMLPLVEQRSSINDKNFKGNTPLHVAASRGRSDAVRLFLEKPHISLFRRELNDQSSVLHEAIKSGNLECVQVFCDFKDKVSLPLNMRTKSDGYTPLHLAIALQETEMALKCLEMEEGIIKKQPSAINVADKNKITPLAQAAMTGNSRVVNAIMDKSQPLKLTLYKQARSRSNFRYDDYCAYGSFPWTVRDGRREFLTENKSPIRYHHHKNGEPDKTSPINCLIREYPEVVIKALDKCFIHHTTNDKSLPKNMQKGHKTEIVDPSHFRVILDFDMLEKHGRKNRRGSFEAVGPQYEPRAYIEDKSPLQIMMRKRSTKHVEMKTHPVVQALVNIKWNNFGFRYFAFFGFLNLLFLSLLAGFTIKTHHDVFRNSTWQCKNGSSYPSVDLDDCFMTQTITSEKSTYTAAVGYALLSLTIILFILGIVDFVDDILDNNRRFIAYITSSMNMIETTSYMLALVFVGATLFLVEDEISTALWQTGAAANVFAFMNIVLILRAVSFLRLGLHIIMFRKIVVTFVKSIGFLFVIFLLGFVCVFHILSVGMSGNSHFADFGSWSPYFKIFTMGVSGASYDDYDTGKEQAVLQLNGYVFALILFAIVMPILFMNLATGLAIEDVQEIRQNAKAEMNDIKIWNIYKAEQLRLILGRTLGKIIGDELYFFQPSFVGNLRQYANIPLSEFKADY